MEEHGHHVIGLDRDDYSYDDMLAEATILPEVQSAAGDVVGAKRSGSKKNVLKQGIRLYPRHKRSFEGKFRRRIAAETALFVHDARNLQFRRGL